MHAVVRDWRSAGVEPKDAALLNYAEKLTHLAAKMEESDLNRLRAVGWDDVAIHDATQIIAYFNYINRIAEGLGVELDAGAPVWGGGKPD
ncbi:MAG: peroxidase [Phycisphaerae bacterium]|nr:peroxidase [Phycisphaerae bacterium]